MSLIRLAFRDIGRSAFRSWAVAIAAFLVAVLGFGALLVTRGADESLARVSGRLGADVIVVPQGSETRVETALLMGGATSSWLPADGVDAIRALPGVDAASPQLYLASLSHASCCTVSDMFLVAFEPESDFTVQPWIDQQLGTGGLGLGEAIGGSLVTVPEGETGVTLYGYPLSIKAKLAPTGTNLDRSLFITAETARAMSSRSVTAAVAPLEIPQDSVSAVLVKVREGSDAAGVASLISNRVPGVSATPEPDMFTDSRRQMAAIFQALLAVIAIAGAFALLFIALVSAMAAHERRRDTGVLRALGATRSGVVAVQVAQSGALTALGGVVGVAMAALLTCLFRDLLIERLGFPYLYPPPGELAMLAVAGLAALVASVSIAVALPAAVAALGDPAATMRD